MTMKDDQDFEDSVGIEWFMRAQESIGKDFAVTDNPKAEKCAAMGVCHQDKIVKGLVYDAHVLC